MFFPKPGEVPQDMTEFRSRFDSGGGSGGDGRGPRFKLGCGWMVVIVFAVATLLWLLGALLRGWYA